MPFAIYALTAGAFGIGLTEFVIMGLLLEVGRDLNVSTATAGLLISGYALGVVIGAPTLTILMRRWPRRRALLALMLIFIAGNTACALAPTYGSLMAARILTSFAHGAFFGIGAVVARRLAGEGRAASAIAIMFTGLTLATVLGVPAGALLGQTFGWRLTFAVIAVIGCGAYALLRQAMPPIQADLSSRLSDDLAALSRPAVWLGLATTVVGYAGVFALFTYIAPFLTQLGGLSERWISPLLVVFGAGLVVGNLAGGQLADRFPRSAIPTTLLLLASVLLALQLAAPSAAILAALMALFGATGFSTVPPLQAWVLRNAPGAGESLASSVNIAAFNLGNAVGAGLGALVIASGPGLSYLPAVAAVIPVLAVGLAALSFRAAQR